MGLRDLFKRRPDRFIQRLEQQAALTARGLDLLVAYMAQPDAALAKQLHATEKEADEVRRILIDELLRTFVTPIDREDLSALSRAIDDVLDYADTTVDEMEILSVQPTPYMARIAGLLHDAAVELDLAVQRLQDNHPGVASDHAQRARSIENRVENVYREALADLFRDPRDVDDVVQMLKLREVYRHLSNAADRGVEAGNIVTDVVVKLT